MLAEVFAVASRKGGTGKTTTVCSLAGAFSERGKRVLVVDLDSQANATRSLGQHPSAPSAAEALYGERPFGTAIRADVHPNMDLVPGGDRLRDADSLMSGPKVLLEAMRGSDVREEYDYVFIDTPPRLGLLVVNALVAADLYVVPITTNFLGLEGLAGFLRILREMENASRLLGILLTDLDRRTKIARQIEEAVRGDFQRTFTTVIPRNVRLAEAPSYGEPVTHYAPESTGAEAYRNLADEIEHRLGRIHAGGE